MAFPREVEWLPELFRKHSRSLRAFVPFPEVEAVRRLACDLRSYDDCRQAAVACPLLRTSHQLRTDATAARVRGDDQAANLRAYIRLQVPHDGHIDPSKHAAVSTRNEHFAIGRGNDVVNSLSHDGGVDRVSQL